MFSDPSNQAKAFAALLVQKVTDKSARTLPTDELDLILMAVAEDFDVKHGSTSRSGAATPAAGDRRISDRRKNSTDR